MGRNRKRQKTIKINPNSNQEEDEDRLSNLPNGLLIEILTLLPIKLAVSTTLLSQQWHNLWTQITSITIDHRHFQNSSSFHSIADAIISQLTSPLIRSFTLQLDDSLDLPPSDVVDSWFRKICSRKVEVIMVNPQFNYDSRLFVFKLSPCVFQCKSLVHLHFLSMFDNEFPDVEFDLPHLKYLGLNYHLSQCWIVAKLTRACPLLETMYLISLDLDEPNDVTIDITSYSLNTLFLYCFDSSGSTKFVINAPNLCSLYFTARTGSICCSAMNLSALLAVRIKVSSETLALSLLKLVSSVLFLDIDVVTLGVFKSLSGEMKDMKPLVFRNLQHLTLDLFDASVDTLNWSATNSVPASLLTYVKHITIKLSKISNEANLLNLTKHLLSGARILKEFNFCVSFKAGGRNREESLRELKICTEFLKCMTSRSSRCQIGFFWEVCKNIR